MTATSARGFGEDPSNDGLWQSGASDQRCISVPAAVVMAILVTVLLTINIVTIERLPA